MKKSNSQAPAPAPVAPDAEALLSKLARLKKFTPEVDGIWDECYAELEQAIRSLPFASPAVGAAPKVRAIAHKENGGWTVRIGNVAIGRWCYRGVVADREATGLANKVNAELEGKKVFAFGCESESFAPGRPSDCKWKGWCGGDNCPVSFKPDSDVSVQNKDE